PATPSRLQGRDCRVPSDLGQRPQYDLCDGDRWPCCQMAVRGRPPTLPSIDVRFTFVESTHLSCEGKIMSAAPSLPSWRRALLASATALVAMGARLPLGSHAQC